MSGHYHRMATRRFSFAKIGHDGLQVKAETGGVGLENIARRLELRYGGAHRFELFVENGIFEVILAINKNAHPTS